METGLANGSDDGGVIEFLGMVDFVAAGVAAGVVVAEVLVKIADGADDVAFHDLHVVDVVEEFEVGVGESFAERGAPCGVIALVVGMIDFGIEEFHQEGDTVFFGEGKEWLEAACAVFESGGVVEACAIS